MMRQGSRRISERGSGGVHAVAALLLASATPVQAAQPFDAISAALKGWDACLMQAIGPARARGLVGPEAAETAMASCASEEQALTVFLAQNGFPPTYAAVARVRLKQKLVALGMPPAPRSAQRAPVYIHDLLRKNKLILPAWTRQVPEGLRGIEWVYRLNGTTFPIQYVERDGTKYAVGSVCEPHNCLGNTVVFAISESGSQVFGLLHAKDIPNGIQVIGSPTAAMSDILFDTAEANAR